MIASSGQSHPCSGFMLRITPPSSMALGIHPITPTLCTHTPQQDLTHREQQTFERRQITDTHVPFRGNPKPVTMCTISTVLCVCVVSSQQRRQQNTSTYFLDSLVKQLQIKGAYPFASPRCAGCCLPGERAGDPCQGWEVSFFRALLDMVTHLVLVRCFQRWKWKSM